MGKIIAKKAESAPSGKPPKEWWNKMVKKIKEGNPKYTKEQVDSTVGSIWSKLSDAKKKTIRGREGKTYKAAASFKEIVALHYQIIEAEKWSKDVDTKWSPKEGFFKQSAEKIASGLKKASKDLKQAMSRLNFYINRSGKNLSKEDKKRLETAKDKLSSLYT